MDREDKTEKYTAHLEVSLSVISCFSPTCPRTPKEIRRVGSDNDDYVVVAAEKRRHRSGSLRSRT